jgi:hypothetical protein
MCLLDAGKARTLMLSYPVETSSRLLTIGYQTITSEGVLTLGGTIVPPKGLLEVTGQAGELKQIFEDVRVNVYGEDMQLVYSGPSSRSQPGQTTRAAPPPRRVVSAAARQRPSRSRSTPVAAPISAVEVNRCPSA